MSNPKYRWLVYKRLALNCLCCNKEILPGKRHYYTEAGLTNYLHTTDFIGTNYGFCGIKCMRIGETVQFLKSFP